MFDLFFAGNVNVNFEPNMKARGANRLGTAEFNWDYLAKWWGELREGGGKVFVDSGAYTAHTKGVTIDIDKYIDYLNEHDEDIYVCAELDKIPGVFRMPKTKEQIASASKESWENYLYMRERVKSPEKVLPIFHQGESFHWLENMLNYMDGNGRISYIGISPANDSNVAGKDAFIEQCFKVIKLSGNPNVKTHAFGMTSLSLLESYPFTSADSTSWVILAGVGGVMTDGGSVMVSEKAKHNAQHYRWFPKPVQEKFREFCFELGYRVEDLEVDYIQRILFNVDYLSRWARNYEYKPRKIKKVRLI